MLKIEQNYALMISLIAIASVAIVEIGIGMITNSMVVISDGIHALFDAMIITILLVMLRLSLKPRDQEHTYGHGRFKNIAGLMGGIMLFIVAILIIREAVTRILFEEVIILNQINMYAVIYAIIIAIFRVFILKITNVHDSKSINIGFYDAFADLGSSSIALLAVILTNIGIYASDSIGSLILAGILLFLTSRVVYSSIMELTDAIDPILVRKARSALSSIKEIKECKDIRMRKVGNDIHVDLIVTLDSSLSFNSAHILSNKIENIIKDAINASVVMIHFEPTEHTIEGMVRDITKEINGVKDVHNIVISETEEGKLVSMHLQIDRLLNVAQAHEIADKVEEIIKAKLNIPNIIIHIEPFMLKLEKLNKIDDEKMRSIIKSIANDEGIKSINKMSIYSSNDILRLDIHCSVNKYISVEEAHEIVTRFERRLKERFNAIVNVHAEP